MLTVFGILVISATLTAIGSLAGKVPIIVPVLLIALALLVQLLPLK